MLLNPSLNIRDSHDVEGGAPLGDSRRREDVAVLGTPTLLLRHTLDQGDACAEEVRKEPDGGPCRRRGVEVGLVDQILVSEDRWGDEAAIPVVGLNDLPAFGCLKEHAMVVFRPHLCSEKLDGDAASLAVREDHFDRRLPAAVIKRGDAPDREALDLVLEAIDWLLRVRVYVPVIKAPLSEPERVWGLG